jgi:patatin-like phospholipase/acyl hydrolase
MQDLKEIPLIPIQKPFRVLSIDGGGVRGLIPLKILSEIEERTAKPIGTLFDLIVGNSTGGIIALGLTAPGDSGQPKYTAKDVLKFYETSLPKIFKKSFFRSIFTGLGLWAPKYNRSNLDTLLQGFFVGNMRLSQVVCPAVVTSYSLTRDDLSLWTSYRAKKDPNTNISIADAAGATSAAPTYFAPKQIVLPHGKESYEADGGIYANDPEEVAVLEALLQNPGLKAEQVFILSLGTGQPKLKKKAGQRLDNKGVIGWLLQINLIDLMLNASTQLEEFQIGSTSLFQRYRIQIDLDPANSLMDNVKEENLMTLEQVADKFIQKSGKELNRICAFLKQRAH